MTAKTKPVIIPEYLENNRYVRDITRLLERLTYRGRRCYEIFDDWLGVCYHALRMMPAHMRHIAEHGTPAPDDDEAATHWQRLRGLYERQDFGEFQQAFHLLLGSAEQLPAWMTQGAYVQFYGQDIDHTCVMMAQTNMMLYGLNGHALRWQAALAGTGMPAASAQPVVEVAVAAPEMPAIPLPQPAVTIPAAPTVRQRQTGSALQLSLFD